MHILHPVTLARTMPEYRTSWLLIAVLTACAPMRATQAPDHVVTIAAGEFARQATPVSFRVPEGVAGGSLQLVDEAGRVLPVQRSGANAIVIVDDLPAGATRRFRLVAGSPVTGTGTGAGVSAVREAGAVVFSVGGQPLLSYHVEESPLPRPDIDPVFRRGGYIHPVRTPSGRVITGDYPADHIHHHGIWAAWTNTVFEGRTPDFWNMGQRRGTVLPVALDSTWSGPVHAGFRARHRYVDLTAPSPKDAVNETWTAHVYSIRGASRPYRVFDLEVVHTMASSSPLVLPEYHYGGVGFRGRDEWTGAENTLFLTSEGKDRSDGHATRARWVHISGHVDGALAGVGILSHPQNFRHPEPMRIHPTEPFFNWAPSQLGEWSIRPDQPWVARYRYVVADGSPDAAELERLWHDFAHPPEVTVSAR